MSEKKTIDRELIRDLANLLDETELTEIEIEQHGIRVRVQRSSHNVTAPVVSAAPVAVAAAPLPEKAPDTANHPGTVTSPMVGTAFRSAEPGAPAFVEAGAMVTEGQTILIVEAMKTFNPIAAPRSGKISAILVEDGQPVEFGEPLLIIE